LKSFLKEKDHPVVSRWVDEKPEEAVPASADEAVTAPQLEMPVAGIPMGGGVTIIFKNAKIYAEKVIIKRKDK
jgi:acetyl-CoA decarbonylase/synthase complex subunit beta